MALIERHPDVEDYILEMSLPEIEARGGVADLVEAGHIVIIKDFRLDFDFEALEGLAKNTDGVTDPDVRRHIKKLEAPQFFEASPAPPWKGRAFPDPLRQALFETLCEGNRRKFRRAANALRSRAS